MELVRGSHGRGGVPAAAVVDGTSLVELTGRSQEEFSRRFKGSPVEHTKQSPTQQSCAAGLPVPACIPAQ